MYANPWWSFTAALTSCWSKRSSIPPLLNPLEPMLLSHGLWVWIGRYEAFSLHVPDWLDQVSQRLPWRAARAGRADRRLAQELHRRAIEDDALAAAAGGSAHQRTGAERRRTVHRVEQAGVLRRGCAVEMTFLQAQH